MQPYFLPYIGYFQLLNTVDKFVLYDNIQYSKKGWINRNRFLLNEKDKMLTLSLEKDSDYLEIHERKVSKLFDKKKMLNQIFNSYKKSPYFEQVFPLATSIINFEEYNLFKYLYNSLVKISTYLEIEYSKMVFSSSININHSLKSEDKVLAICKELGASEYYNPPGGIDLYNGKTFSKNRIKLKFIQSKPVIYRQFKNEFIPMLSIIDVMMFNKPDLIKKYLNYYELI